MQCPKCKSIIDVHAKFCPDCGAAIPKVVDQPPTSAQAKKKRLWIGLAIGAGSCLVLGMAVVIVILLMNKPSATPQAQPVSAQTTSPTSTTPTNSAATPATTVSTTTPSVPAQKVNLRINQVDTSHYPLMDLYITATDEQGNKITKMANQGLSITDNGTLIPLQNSSLQYMSGSSEPFSMNLLIDVSGSMEGENMELTKAAALNFLDEVPMNAHNKVGLISFDNTIFVDQDFTGDKNLLKRAIRGLQVENETALYDALNTALIRTSKQEGAKVIIAFTDGMDNSSFTAPEDVTELSKKLGIPIYIVALGHEVDMTTLIHICEDTRGKFVRIDSMNELLKAYQLLFQQQEEQFKLSVHLPGGQADQTYRDLTLHIANDEYKGEGMVSYLPNYTIDNDVYRDYSNYGDDNYLFENSDHDYLIDSELKDLSLGELAIARNEIFARHGYQFKRKQFAEYFATKSWYVPDPSYNGSDSALNATEIANYKLIKLWEKNKAPSKTP